MQVIIDFEEYKKLKEKELILDGRSCARIDRYYRNSGYANNDIVIYKMSDVVRELQKEIESKNDIISAQHKEKNELRRDFEAVKWKRRGLWSRLFS